MKENTKRIYLLDELRGFALICMVVHHAFLDIGYVLGYSWGYMIFDKLCLLQPIFWGIFIGISGICSRLSRNTLKRGLIVFGAGLIITLVTAVIMPAIGMEGAEIYFGILSCLGSCMIITGLLMPLIKKTKPLIGMVVCMLLFVITYNISSGTIFFGLVALPRFLYETNYLCPLGFYNETFFSADYFAIFPWVFLFLCGSFLGKYAKDGAFPKFAYKSHLKFLQKIGKNSLWVYLLHQPVLYGIMYIVSFIQLLVLGR